MDSLPIGPWIFNEICVEARASRRRRSSGWDLWTLASKLIHRGRTVWMRSRTSGPRHTNPFCRLSSESGAGAAARADEGEIQESADAAAKDCWASRSQFFDSQQCTTGSQFSKYPTSSRLRLASNCPSVTFPVAPRRRSSSAQSECRTIRGSSCFDLQESRNARVSSRPTVSSADTTTGAGGLVPTVSGASANFKMSVHEAAVARDTGMSAGVAGGRSRAISQSRSTRAMDGSSRRNEGVVRRKCEAPPGRWISVILEVESGSNGSARSDFWRSPHFPGISSAPSACQSISRQAVVGEGDS